MRRRSAGAIAWYSFEELEGQGVTHAFFTRLGGVSVPPYATLNLGHTVGDDLAAVQENHRRAFAALGLCHKQVASPYQVHGAHVRLVGRAHTGTIQPATDGLLTATAGVALLLRFADCVPLLLFDRRRRAVGMVHAGWKGAAAGIALAAVGAFVRHFGTRPEDLWAGIGPAIGPCCYQVDGATAEAVARVCPPDAGVVQCKNGALYLDLPGAVRAQLAAAGVKRIEASGICTCCHTDEWFSHRAEKGRTGRFGALAMLDF